VVGDGEERKGGKVAVEDGTMAETLLSVVQTGYATRKMMQ
jgi:hypothetical protein